MATLINNPKLVSKAKALRKKGLTYGAIAKQMRLRDNKAAWVLCNDTPGMDRSAKGGRGAKVAAKSKRTVKAAAKSKRITRKAA